MRWYSVAEGKRIPRKKGQPANSKNTDPPLTLMKIQKELSHGLGLPRRSNSEIQRIKIRKKWVDPTKYKSSLHGMQRAKSSR